eukprot:1756373-Prymnesium_polylepis.1
MGLSELRWNVHRGYTCSGELVEGRQRCSALDPSELFFLTATTPWCNWTARCRDRTGVDLRGARCGDAFVIRVHGAWRHSGGRSPEAEQWPIAMRDAQSAMAMCAPRL